MWYGKPFDLLKFYIPFVDKRSSEISHPGRKILSGYFHDEFVAVCLSSRETADRQTAINRYYYKNKEKKE
jgi:hypothetical protein